MLNKKFLGLLILSALVAVGCGENRAGQLRPVAVAPAEPEAVKIDEATILIAKGDGVEMSVTGDLSAALNEAGKIESIIKGGKILPVPTTATTTTTTASKEEPGAKKDDKAAAEKPPVVCQIEKTANTEKDIDLSKDGKQASVSLSVDSATDIKADAKAVDQVTVMSDKAGNIVMTCTRKGDASSLSIADLNKTFDGRAKFAKAEKKEEAKK